MPGYRRWLYLEALALLLAFRPLLHMLRLSQLQRLVQALARQRVSNPTVQAAEVGEVVTRLAHMLGGRCLPQAVVTYIMLRRRQLAAQIELGVRYDNARGACRPCLGRA